MSESPEIAGSMPSVPQGQPLQHKPNPVYAWVFVGFFLCAVCLLGFPKYANTDPLGTGIFDGMGLTVLLLAISGLCNGVARRVGRNRPPKATEAGTGLGVTRRKRRSNSVGVGLFFALFGVCLLVFPGATTQINGAGLLMLLIGLISLSTVVFRRSRESRRGEAAEARSGPEAQGRRRKSNGMGVSFFWLLLGVYWLAFPQGTSMDAFSRGFFYGMGFIILLFAIMALSSGVSRRMTRRVSPGE